MLQARVDLRWTVLCLLLGCLWSVPGPVEACGQNLHRSSLNQPIVTAAKRPSPCSFDQHTLALTIPTVKAHHRLAGIAVHNRIEQPMVTRAPIRGPAKLDLNEDDSLWQKRCAELENKTEKHLQAYISGFEALTSTIQDLDEVVQQMKPTERTCASPIPNEGSESSHSEVVSGIAASTSTTGFSSHELAATDPTTTESFTDPPIFDRRKREADSSTHYGMPLLTSPSTLPTDQADDDLIKASNDLKALRKDLSSTAEWLKQTNNTVHSVMLRALQAYVTSIERRIDHQRQLSSQTRGTKLKTKIAVIKEKVASLMEKLKSLVPFRQGDINRADQVANTGTTMASNPSSVRPTVLPAITAASVVIPINDPS